MNECITCDKPGQYRDLISGMCHNCGPNCLICEDGENCKKCLPNYFISHGICVLCNEESMQQFGSADGSGLCADNKCPKPGNYFNYGVCILCESNCLICDGPSTCRICARGYYTLNGKCSKCDQPNQVRPESKTGVCRLCTENCAVCKSPIACSKCQAPFVINPSNGKCETCDDSADLKVILHKEEACSRCFVQNCEKCQESEVCSRCKHGYFISEDGRVCSACQELGKVIDPLSKRCLQCPSNCLFCSSPNSSEKSCIICMKGFYLFKGVCQEQCDVDRGYYVSLRPENYASCSPCGAHCESCLNNSTCLRCRPAFALFQGQCVDCEEAGRAVEVVGGEDPTVLKCSFCNPLGRCKKCANSHQCQTCEEGFFLVNGVCQQCNVRGFATFIDEENNKTVCKSPCPTGTYHIKNSCLKCMEGCDVCENSSTCIRCRQGFFFNKNGVCDPCDRLGMFRSPDNSGFGFCGICPSNCAVCLNETVCISCRESFFLNVVSGECELCAGPGLFINFSSKTCQRCSSNCESCSDFYNCKICSADYFLKDGMCTLCNSSGELQTANRLCMNCPEGCELCTSPETCERCSSLFLFEEKACVPCDGRNDYRKIDVQGRRLCSQCDPLCLLCDSEMNCLVCPEGYALFQGGCSPCNATGLVLQVTDSGNNICLRCAENCKWCADKFSCKVCYPKFFLSELTGHCSLCNELNEVKKGPDDGTGRCLSTLAKLVAVQRCKPSGNCLLCDEIEGCLLCKPGFYLLNKTCDLCQGVGLFRPEEDISGRANCQNCGRGCADCLNATSCRNCLAGWYLEAGRCGKCDQEGRYRSADFDGKAICVSCNDPSCRKCSHPLRCDLCFSGYFVNQLGRCQECDDKNCHICDGAHFCQECIRNWFIKDGVCVTCDQSGSFRGSDGLCHKCAEHCDLCLSETRCEECKLNWFRNSTGKFLGNSKTEITKHYFSEKIL